MTTAIQHGLDVSRAYTTGEATHLEAKRARIAANFTPPDGHVFAYELMPRDEIQMTTLVEVPDRKRMLRRDLVHLGGLGMDGATVLGDRLYFDFAISDDDPAGPMAIMSLVDYRGDRGKNRLALAVRSTLQVIEGIEVIPAMPMERSLAWLPDIEAAGFAEYGITPVAQQALRPIEEPEPPRGRRSE
jgi:hypothetical protein